MLKMIDANAKVVAIVPFVRSDNHDSKRKFHKNPSNKTKLQRTYFPWTNYL